MNVERIRLADACAEGVAALQQERGLDAITALEAEVTTSIDYPVLSYPQKVKSMTFDKLPEVSGVLMGIKGQYLMLDTGVINMRRHAGYDVSLAVTEES